MRAILANSGGIDSRVSAAMLAAEGWTLHSVYLDWTHLPGQSEAAAETARRYCASHDVVPWTLPEWIVDNPRTLHPTLPLIGLLTTALAASRSESLRAEAIASGLRSEVRRPDFPSLLEQLMESSVYRPRPTVLLPVFDLSASAITAKGKALGVDLDGTWSCTASDPHCGVCASCRRRVAQGISLGMVAA